MITFWRATTQHFLYVYSATDTPTIVAALPALHNVVPGRFPASAAVIGFRVVYGIAMMSELNGKYGKIPEADWHTTKSAFVDALLIDELSMAVAFRLGSYALGKLHPS